MSLLLLLPLVVEEGPAPEDVTAGWIAFVVFIGLILAVAFLGFSLFKQLRRAQAAKDAGVYGDEPAPGSDGPGSERPGSPAP